MCKHIRITGYTVLMEQSIEKSGALKRSESELCTNPDQCFSVKDTKYAITDAVRLSCLSQQYCAQLFNIISCAVECQSRTHYRDKTQCLALPQGLYC